MAQLVDLVINDTGSLVLPSGTDANRPTVSATVESFTTVGNTSWTCPAGVNSVEVLVVAGGGGGGRYGGGGGAGGLIYRNDYPVIPGTSYGITVGAGGAGHPGDAQSGGTASNGNNSIFADLVAIGGGGGGNYNQSGSVGAQKGADGGSGGGTGSNGNDARRQLEQHLGGSPVRGQGNRGGIQATGYATGGGGGGGAGGGGEDAPPGGPGGRGGVGLEFSITGTPTYYAGGGGGGANNGYNSGLLIPGGKGGGGNGLSPGGTSTSIDGAANTGGGGGGGADNTIGGTTRAGNGGSGIVILRYSTASTAGQTRYNTNRGAIEQYRKSSQWNTDSLGEGIIKNGLLCWLDANKYTSGTTWYDLSGRGNNATLFNSPTYTQANGGYFTLDGSTQYMELPAATVPGGREITFGCWIKGVVNKSSSIVEAANGSSRVLNLHLTWSDSNVYWDVNATDGTNNRIFKNAPKGDYYDWAYWVCTFDREYPNQGSNTTGRMRIYRNGQLWHEGEGTSNPFTSATRVRIGAYATSATPSTFHQGPVAMVHFYNRALEPDEVRKNYEATKWRFIRPPTVVRSGNEAPGSSRGSAAPNARYIKEQTGTTRNGFYWLAPGNQEPIYVYCDMNYDGGGWTLVMCNTLNGALTGGGPANGTGGLTYYQSINHVWYNQNPDMFQGKYGDYGYSRGNNLSNRERMRFKCLVGLKYWTNLGLNVAQFAAADAYSLSETASHTKRYRWRYTGFNSSYGFLGASAVGDDGSGAGSPGMYSYHAANGFSWTTYDRDQDTNSGNCATYYGNNPFWYGSCWSGNMWGGGNSGGYQDGPFWDSSGSDYHNYMAVYLKV